MGKEDEKESGRDKMKSFGSIRSIFMHADGVDWILMALGLIGAVGDGFITPVVVFIFNTLLNNLGTSSSNNKTFMQTISKVFYGLYFLFFFPCFSL
ncbi:ABC transporter B family member 17 [Arabidopsis thaliana]